jgi:hypothetical protein
MHSEEPTKPQRINIYFGEGEDLKLLETLRAIATQRKRSVNQMAKILLTFALHQKDLLPDEDL